MHHLYSFSTRFISLIALEQNDLRTIGRSLMLNSPFLFDGCFLLLSRRLRAKLSRILYYREMMSGIDKFFEDTLNRAAKASRPTQEVRFTGDYMFSSTAFNFIQKNLAMEPPVYYVPSVYRQIEAFAIVVKAWEPPPPVEAAPPPPPPPAEPPLEEEPPWAWDGSFSSIVAGTLLFQK